MPTQVYETAFITLLNGKKLYLTPLKIKYLRGFMKKFDEIKNVSGDDATIAIFVECAAISMEQYCPELASVELIEDLLDLKTLYKIMEIAGGIKMKEDDKESVEEQANSEENNLSWNELDLAKLESELFLLGIWKDYEELESSISMQELSSILEAKRESDYENKKFSAAIQGVDLEGASEKKGNAWEEMKARAFSRGQTDNPNDVLALRGPAAAKAGFGIGMGLGYEKWD